MTDEPIIEEQLHEMQEHKWREESIQMDIEGITPFDVGFQLITAQISIGNQPKERGHHKSGKDAVHKHHIEDEIDALPESEAQYPGESQ